MKVAIVHDWINSSNAGAPRVVLAIAEMFPDAPIYTSVYDPEKAAEFNKYDVRTSFIQKLGPLRKKHQYFPFLRQRAFERMDFSDYDLVISSSGSEAKGIKTGPNTLHINYCHAPTHYYWRHYEDYIKHPGFGALDPIARIGLKLMIGRARKWDLKAAQRPDEIISNSSFIAKEVQKYYSRDAHIIHPPVDISRFAKVGKEKRAGLIVVGRQEPFKRIDLAVEACTALDIPLTVVGTGSQHERLKQLAGSSVTFRTGVDDEELSRLFQEAAGFIFPSEDDFGIVAAESLGAGTPIIAFGTGGSRDIVEEGKSGLFFKEPTSKSLQKALKQFENMSWDHTLIQASAKRFSKQRFQKELQALIDSSSAAFFKK